MSESIDKKQVIDKYTALISKPRIERLASLGLDIVETAREGSKVFDADGRGFYDCFCSGGQFVIGHRSPEMVAALRDAVREADLGNFLMLSAQKAALAKKLADVTPGALKISVFGVSRGESNDFALKLSRGFTGRSEFVCFEGGEHGETGFALSVSDRPEHESLFGPLIPFVSRVPMTVESLKSAVSDKTAAVIVEPVQSDAGVVMPPRGFLEAARRVCDRRGALLIFDEGRLAFGRTGKMFECMRSGVTPDILTVGKGMGGTVFPITSTIFTPRVNRFMITHTLIHLSTFGGADTGCMVAVAAIDHIIRKRLVANAEAMGNKLIRGLKSIATDTGKLVEARGVGLLAGVEAESAEAAAAFTRELAAFGVIALPAPGNPAVVRFTPPIDITDEETDGILDAADTAASKI